MGEFALVTGGGTGVGRAAALALAEAGWRVALTGRRREPLDATAAAIARAGGPPALVAPADVTVEAEVEALFAAIEGAFGRLDFLFANAGRGAPASEIDALDPALWRSVLEVNVTGVFLCARAAFAQMKRQRPKGGRIVLNGSVSATTPRPGSAAYTASKHAITGLTKTLSLDGRRHAIAVGQIDIGNAASEMTERMADGVPQADGSVRPEPVMDVRHVGSTIVHMASLPLDANVLFTTVMANAMPFVGRG